MTARQNHHFRMLLADDDPLYQLILRRLLTRWGYEVTLAGDGTMAWQVLQSSDPPRLALLDWMMPGIHGPEICARARAVRQEPYTYILVLSARTDSGDLVAAMEAGADDYLTKPFDAHELRARLRAGRRIIELQDELIRAREAMREEATRDSLTGALNRRAILTYLAEEIVRASRQGQPLAVLLTDIDYFKGINDTFGHSVGDAVLVETVRRMKESLRCYDALGRYGGEEFLIVLPGCDGNQARQLAERICDAVRTEPFPAAARTVRLTCSVGVSWRMPKGNADADSLIRDADIALYQAKRSGRNRVEESPAEIALWALVAATAEPDATLIHTEGGQMQAVMPPTRRSSALIVENTLARHEVFHSGPGKGKGARIADVRSDSEA